MQGYPEMKPYDAGPPAFAAIFWFIVFSGMYLGIGLLAGYLIWGMK